MYTSLKERYMPIETKDLIKLTSRFERCKMKSHELERLNNEMDDNTEGTKKSERTLMAIIVSHLPKDRYSAVITTLQGKLDDLAFTWTKFVMEIMDFYEDSVKPSGRRWDGGNDRKNITLSMNNRKTGGSYKKFKGLCCECKKKVTRRRIAGRRTAAAVVVASHSLVTATTVGRLDTCRKTVQTSKEVVTKLTKVCLLEWHSVRRSTVEWTVMLKMQTYLEFAMTFTNLIGHSRRRRKQAS
jgi:hypothetical protein